MTGSFFYRHEILNPNFFACSLKKLIAKRDAYKSMSVCALVESLIIEMDLYNVVKSLPDSDNSVNAFHTAISIAQAYEDHCIQMSLPCTIYGFIDYITTVKAKAAGKPDQKTTLIVSKGSCLSPC